MEDCNDTVDMDVPEASGSNTVRPTERVQSNPAVDTSDEMEQVLALVRLSPTVNLLLEATPASSLSDIVQLDLSGQGLSSLPECMDTRLPNLSILFLSNNRFAQVPAVIGQCPQLQMVAFKSNNGCLTSIHPDALQSQLRWLILTDNALTEIPDTIARCGLLQKCMLAGNRLTRLPSTAAISQLKNLQLIRLASNRLEQAPMELLSLPNLCWVALGDNPFLQTKDPTSSNPSINDKTNNQTSRVIPVLANLDTVDGRVLGTGAGGVTRAVQYQGRTVAVKTYHSNAMTSDGNPATERQVALLASQLYYHSIDNSQSTIPTKRSNNSTPPLIQVLGECEKTGSLVMEFLENFQTLAQPPNMETCSRDVYLPIDESDGNTSRPWTWDPALNLVTQLLDAMVRLHGAGIAHGDFYGHNILVQQSDLYQVKLSDFGAAFFYDKSAPYGPFLERIELRAFAVLVQEVAAHLLLLNDGDDYEDKLVSSKQNRLEKLISQCHKSNATFDNVYIWWQQQRLAEIATDFGVVDDDQQ